MTPRLFAQAVRGRGQAMKARRRENAWLAYHVELLARMKELPPSPAHLVGEAEPTKPKTADELWAAMQQWAAMHNAREAQAAASAGG